jgi:hypothetical protein
MLINEVRKEIRKQLPILVKGLMKELMPIIKEIAIASAKEYLAKEINRKR